MNREKDRDKDREREPQGKSGNVLTLEPEQKTFLTHLNTFTQTVPKNSTQAIESILEAYRTAGQPLGPPSPSTLKQWVAQQVGEIIERAYPQSRMPGHEQNGSISGGGGGPGTGYSSA